MKSLKQTALTLTGSAGCCLLPLLLLLLLLLLEFTGTLSLLPPNGLTAARHCTSLHYHSTLSSF